MKPLAYIKAQRIRRNLSAFKALIDTPASSTAQLPANGRFAIRSTAGNAAGTLALTIVTNRTINIYTKVLISGQIQIVDNIQKAAVVTVETGFDLLLDIGMGKFIPVING